MHQRSTRQPSKIVRIVMVENQSDEDAATSRNNPVQLPAGSKRLRTSECIPGSTPMIG
jgi:hypothetical protein